MSTPSIPVQDEQGEREMPGSSTAAAQLNLLGARLVRVDQDAAGAPILVAKLGGKFIRIYCDGTYGPWREVSPVTSPEKGEAVERDPWEAMGKPIPLESRSAALKHVRDMVPGITTSDATALVERVALALEADDPYKALREATHAPVPQGPPGADDGNRVQRSVEPTTPVALDTVGGYRLMAVLLAGVRS